MTKPTKTGTMPTAGTSTKSAVKNPSVSVKTAAVKKVPTEKVPAKSAANASAVAPTSTEPSLRFYHSKVLRTRTHGVLAALEATPDHPKHREALAELVNDLIEAGMDYYFLRALKQADVGFVAEQSARLGMSGAVRLISSVSRKFIVRMAPQQLLVVAAHIRTLT